MATKLQSIAQSLREERSRLTEERNAVEARLQQMDAELESIERALSALEEKPKQAKQKSGKPAPKRQDVEDLVRQILDKGALDTDSLKKKVGAKLTKQGCSQMGLSLRLNEVLASGHYIESPAGWKLLETEVEETVKA